MSNDANDLNLCELIQKYKEEKSLSFEDLAEKLNVSVGTVFDLTKPEKARKASAKTLSKISVALNKSLDEIKRCQELLNPENLAPTEKEIESGERKLSICPGCYKIEKIEADYKHDDDRVDYQIISPTFYNDVDYSHCVDCGASLDSFCKECKKPILSLEHKHCPYCGDKYPGRGGTWCKKCDFSIDYKQLKSRIAKCPQCNAPFPYNFEFSEQSNIKDYAIWFIYAQTEDHYEINKKDFEMMFPLYEINNEIETNKAIGNDLKNFLIKCVENLNSLWNWSEYDTEPLVDKIFLERDDENDFLSRWFDFNSNTASRRPSTFILHVANDLGLFGRSPYSKKVSLPELSDKKTYGEFDFLKLCDSIYKSGEYSNEYLESIKYPF